MRFHASVLFLRRGLTMAALVVFGPAANAGTLYLARLSGANENPPTTSTATGIGVLVLNDAETQATVTATHDISIPVTGGHIHRGVVSTNGPVIFPFPAPASPVGPLTWAIPAADVDNLKNLGLYMNFHTAVNPGGAIRGQLVRALLSPAAMTPAQMRLANVLDLSAGYDADLDQLLIQTNLASAAGQTQTLEELTARTLYVQGRQQIEAMNSLTDGVFAYADELRASQSAAAPGQFNLFLRGGDEFGRRSATGNQAASTFSRPFLVAGADYGFTENTRGGLALGYVDARDTFRNGAGKTKTETTALQAFLSFGLGDSGVAVDAAAGYGWGRIDTTRNLASLARAATASPDGKVWAAALKASRAFKTNSSTRLVPYALIDVQKASVDAYTESGAGAADLVVPRHNTWNSAFEAGASLVMPMQIQSGALAVRLEAGWRRLLEDGAGSFTTWLAGSPRGFGTQIDGPGKNSAHVGVALTETLRNGVLVTLASRGVLGAGNQTIHALEGSVVLKF
jgi:hypothetical protein